jgi:hypothetical protein
MESEYFRVTSNSMASDAEQQATAKAELTL